MQKKQLSHTQKSPMMYMQEQHKRNLYVYATKACFTYAKISLGAPRRKQQGGIDRTPKRQLSHTQKSLMRYMKKGAIEIMRIRKRSTYAKEPYDIHAGAT